MTLLPWKIKHSDYLLRDEWLNLRADRCETPEGHIVEPYYVIETRDWVHVAAFDSMDRILITRQYRHGSSVIMTEIPCGIMEDGEAPLTAAKRELLEETGCSSESFESLGTLYPDPARMNNRIHLFMCTNVREVREPVQDESEKIEHEFIEVEELLRLIDTGEFSESRHLASLFLALRRRGMMKFNPKKSVTE